MNSTYWQLFSFEASGLLLHSIICLPNTPILLTTVCLLASVLNKIGVLQKRWLILAHTSITQLFFLKTTSYFRIQQTYFVYIVPILSQCIKTDSHGLTSNEINTLLCFIKVILMRNWYFSFLSTMSDGKKYGAWCSATILIHANMLFCPSLLLHRHHECQHTEKGKWCLSIIVTGVMTSWTVYKCLKSPQGTGTACEGLATPSPGYTLKERGETFKTTCARASNQTNYIRAMEMRAQGSFLFNSLPGVSPVSRLRNFSLWTCLQTWVPSSLFPYFNSSQVLCCAENMYLPLFQLIQILYSVRKPFRPYMKKVMKIRHWGAWVA